MSIQKLAIYFVSLFMVTSCASRGGVNIQASQKSSLRLLQKTAVGSLPAGKRNVSSNARTFTSNYFIPKGSPRFWNEPKKRSKFRFYATITILGDQRPYTVEFTVIKEVKSGAEFKEVGKSIEAAKALSSYYKQNLEKGLKDRNFVDDFRVF